MPWQETQDHNRRLLDALSQLALEKGALERLAGAINNDARAQDTDRARQGSKHKPRNSLIAESTLVRWQEEGLDRIVNAQPHKKRIVYEFLERSAEFRTALLNSMSGLPSGLTDFALQHSRALSRVLSTDLSSLDGVYRLYRPASHLPRLSAQRVQISRLTVKTSSGITQFSEYQKYADPDSPNFPVDQTDNGIVVLMSGSVVLLGANDEGYSSKIYSASFTYPSIGQKKPVRRISGVMHDVDGSDTHRSYRFVASRSLDPWEEIEMGIFRPPHDLLPQDVLDTLDFGGTSAIIMPLITSRSP